MLALQSFFVGIVESLLFFLTHDFFCGPVPGASASEGCIHLDSNAFVGCHLNISHLVLNSTKVTYL